MIGMIWRRVLGRLEWCGSNWRCQFLESQVVGQCQAVTVRLRPWQPRTCDAWEKSGACESGGMVFVERGMTAWRARRPGGDRGNLPLPFSWLCYPLPPPSVFRLSEAGERGRMRVMTPWGQLSATRGEHGCWASPHADEREHARPWEWCRSGSAGWKARPKRSFSFSILNQGFPIYLIYSKSFSIFYFLYFNYAKHLYINKYIYCLHLYNKMGSTKYIFGFQPFSKVIITYSFNLSNSLNKIWLFLFNKTKNIRSNSWIYN
jgi:hypothetical protein